MEKQRCKAEILDDGVLVNVTKNVTPKPKMEMLL